jgi:hypothetical protein
LGVRFLARGASKDQGGALLSKVEVYLETERLVTEGEENVIELRLCAASADDQALPVDPCVAESFRIMDRMRQGRATWVLKSDFTIFAGGLYWVVLQVRVRVTAGPPIPCLTKMCCNVFITKKKMSSSVC